MISKKSWENKLSTKGFHEISQEKGKLRKEKPCQKLTSAKTKKI